MATNTRRRLLKALPALVIVLVLLGAGFLVYLLRGLLAGSPPAPKQTVQQISLVQPPPPPPPPKVEKPPEPEMKEEVPEPEPEPEEVPEELPDLVNDEPPAGDLLGLDAEGGAGGDGFGLIGRKGGRGLLSDGSRFGSYAGLIKEDIVDALSAASGVRDHGYSVLVKLWIDQSGRVERYELLSSTGDRKTDESLRLAFSSLPRLSQPPPEDMPQPVKLRVTSRL
jgi:TonB family protein